MTLFYKYLLFFDIFSSFHNFHFLYVHKGVSCFYYFKIFMFKWQLASFSVFCENKNVSKKYHFLNVNKDFQLWLFKMYLKKWNLCFRCKIGLHFCIAMNGFLIFKFWLYKIFFWTEKWYFLRTFQPFFYIEITIFSNFKFNFSKFAVFCRFWTFFSCFFLALFLTSFLYCCKSKSTYHFWCFEFLFLCGWDQKKGCFSAFSLM